MKTSLDHLPEGKRRELAHVVETVREGFARATAQRTQPRYRNGKLLKIILFGSYARGDWVEDPVGRYFSDYDLLIVVNHDDLTDIAEFWEKTESQLLADLSAGTVLRTPVSLIYHSLDDVNDKLRLGRYFFMDILRDGISLFEEPEHPFVEPHRYLRSRHSRRRRTISTSGLKALTIFSKVRRKPPEREKPSWPRSSCIRRPSAIITACSWSALCTALRATI